MRAKDAVGRYGERVAARHVETHGLEVLERNWRGAGGELDLVARDGDVLVAIEVKTRRGTGFGHPAEAVTPAKLSRIRRLTGQWIAEHRDVRCREIRVDVVAVVLPRAGAAQVEHLVGVL
ncbi:YraN family protein [Isoptericola sp. NPDC019693]|uniref:YraN family protein n=1 Tax=Isoptericola sp. NPDC019693 TaxID=3364009 RepID=UPI0037AD6D99